jgi:hypothetical protein
MPLRRSLIASLFGVALLCTQPAVADTVRQMLRGDELRSTIAHRGLVDNHWFMPVAAAAAVKQPVPEISFANYATLSDCGPHLVGHSVLSGIRHPVSSLR